MRKITCTALSSALGAVTLFVSPASLAGDCEPAWSTAIGNPGMSGGGFTGSYVSYFAVHDDGTGDQVYAVGGFSSAGGQAVNRIARWDGASWSPLPSQPPITANWINKAVSFQGDLYIGATFDNNGGIDGGLAQWDGSEWSIPGDGVYGETMGITIYSVWALAIWNDGEKDVLVAAGQFNDAGGVPVNNIAAWDGESWSDVGGGVTGGVAGPVILDMVVYDDGSGPALYAAGRFATAGGQPAASIAKWDGEEWSALGAGLGGLGASALHVFDDGSGDALYVTGNLNGAGGQPANRIAKWDGSQWSTLGDGLGGPGRGLGVYDDGTGDALYVVGSFSTAGGSPASYIAKWDGGTWSGVGGGLTGGSSALALLSYDDGSGEGESLFVGGSFIEADAEPVEWVVKWVGCADSSGIPGDLDGSGTVDGADLAILLGAWGACADCDDCDADLDGNCDVDGADLAILLGNWG